MSRAALVSMLLVSACGFEHGQLSPGDAAPDSPAMMMPDSQMKDSPTAKVVHTRLIDIVDANVIAGPHTDFPLLVSLSQTWLRDTAHGGAVQSASGFDIGFSSDAAGATPLSFEIDRYAPDTGDLAAWVKLPALAATTTLYIHYGDPAITTSHENIPAVWSGGFGGVWHMRSTLVDSVAGGAATNSGTTGTDGKIGEARSFDGSANFIDVASSTRIDDIFAGGGTAEAWCNADTFGEGSLGRIFEKGSSSATPNSTTGWLFAVDNNNVASSLLFVNGASTQVGEWNAPASSMSTGQWVHVAVVYNRDSSANVPQVFVNGQAQTPTANPTPMGTLSADTGVTLRIGNRTGTDRTFDGSIDEARLSTVSRSSGWIETEYRNQNDPASFLSVGPEL